MFLPFRTNVMCLTKKWIRDRIADQDTPKPPVCKREINVVDVSCSMTVAARSRFVSNLLIGLVSRRGALFTFDESSAMRSWVLMQSVSKGKTNSIGRKRRRFFCLLVSNSRRTRRGDDGHEDHVSRWSQS